MPNNPNLKELIVVGFGGAIGGLLSYFNSLVTKDQLLASAALSILVSVCLGAFVALVVVFLVRWVKTRNVALLFIWAMVSGFLWKPAASAVTTYGGQIIQNRIAAAAKQSAHETLKKSDQLQPTLAADKINPEIDDTLGSAVQTVKALPEVKDKDAQNQVRDSVATTAGQLSEVAIKSDDPAVAQKASEALNTLGQTAVETKSYGVANAISKSLDDVSNKGKDPQARRTAWDAKQRIDAANVPVSASPKG